MFHKLDLSRLKVLRCLEVAAWVTELGLTNARNTIVMEVFSTISSVVFSELVIIIWHDLFVRTLLDVTFFKTLRMMDEIRPFKLVFSLHIRSQNHPPWARLRIFENAIESAMEDGLDFLNSPPILRIVRLDP